jgi:hypothetical protein
MRVRTSDTSDGLLARKIGYVDEGVIEASEEMRNAEN